MAWEIETDVRGRTVKATFVGHLDTSAGAESAHAFAKKIRELDLVDVVFDVRQMTGYDRGARVAWQASLVPLKERVLGIEVVGGNSLIRMGASVLALAAGIPIKVVEEPSS